MNTDDRDEVNKVVHDEMRRRFRTGICPKCKADTVFIKFDVYLEEDSLRRSRCLNCLAVVEMKTVLVEESARKDEGEPDLNEEE